MSTLLEDAPTTTLEVTEEAPEDEPSNLLHLYCRRCLEDLYPQRILPHCGTNRPRNDDEMTYQSEAECPPQELCVVCVHSTCSVCGP